MFSELSTIDWIVLGLVALYGLRGMRHGLERGVLELTGLGVSLWLALRWFEPASEAASEHLELGVVLVRPLAFVALWAASDVVFRLLVFRLLRLPELRPNGFSTALGVLPGAARGLVIATLWATLLLALPVPDAAKAVVQDGRLASRLVEAGTALSGEFSSIFGEAAIGTLDLLSLHPDPNERVQLPFRVAQPRADAVTEKQMLALVNEERRKAGLPPLEIDPGLREVAREHAADMFQRGYFAHRGDDGRTAVERSRDAGIQAGAIGENIALAPNLEVAHRGLMESKGHRDNILNPRYRRVGIGVQDGGLNGKMFAQVFAG